MANSEAEDKDGDEEESVSATLVDGLEFLVSWREKLLALHASPPEMIYHYTSAQTLVDILEQNEIWATNAVYMNDQSEVRHASEILKTASDNLFADPAFVGAKPERLLTATTPIRNVMNRLHDYVEVYVTCFCSEKDLLSQWRGYGEGGGVSIGFNSSQLRKVVDDTPGFYMFLVQVTYEPAQQYELLFDLAKEWTLMYLNALTKDDRTRAHVETMLFAQSFALLAASFKNDGFTEEKEWRLIYVRTRLPQVLPEEPFEINFRVSDGMVIPFIRFTPIDENGNRIRLPVREIRVGPHRYPALAQSGVWHLLGKLGLLSEVDLDRSSTPLRT